MAPKKESKAGIKAYLYNAQIERAFIIFGIIYFPVSLLFLGRGQVAELSLMLYTAIMLMVAAALFLKFVLVVAKNANSSKPNMGDVIVTYVLDILIPLQVVKMAVYVIVRLLPTVHQGFMCDLRHFIIDFLNLYNVQQNLTYAILFSFAAVFVAGLWTIANKSK